MLHFEEKQINVYHIMTLGAIQVETLYLSHIYQQNKSVNTKTRFLVRSVRRIIREATAHKWLEKFNWISLSYITPGTGASQPLFIFIVLSLLVDNMQVMFAVVYSELSKKLCR